MVSKEDTAQIAIEGQYLKDLSVENPNSPNIFFGAKAVSEVDVRYDVKSEKLNETMYEVILHITATAYFKEDNTPQKAFLCDLQYSGLFTVKSLVGEELEKLIFVHAPTLLFPFARQIIASSTTDCGFPALMLVPVDFGARYTAEKQKPGTGKLASYPSANSNQGH